jgi:hypothetical protein
LVRKGKKSIDSIKMWFGNIADKSQNLLNSTAIEATFYSRNKITKMQSQNSSDLFIKILSTSLSKALKFFPNSTDSIATEIS